MPDREKVIRIIDELIFEAQKEPTWKAENALRCLKKELLKEREAVNPIAKEGDTYECICGAVVGWDELDASGIVQTRFNYCPFCGRSVKWE